MLLLSRAASRLAAVAVPAGYRRNEPADTRPDDGRCSPIHTPMTAQARLPVDGMPRGRAHIRGSDYLRRHRDFDLIPEPSMPTAPGQGSGADQTNLVPP